MMVRCEGEETRYRIRCTNGTHEVYADATSDKGGSDTGFRPHELLEAALGCCMNMWIRMYADGRGIAISGVTTHVSVHRDTPEEAVFQYTVQVNGALNSQQREELQKAMSGCPVRQTLSRRISFQQRDTLP